MNEKQNKIIEAYHEIYNCLHEIPLASDQKEFLTRFHKFQKSVCNLQKLECRGVEQHEFHLGLTDKEYKALRLELIYRFCR
jgi:hypothetical protein